MNTTAFAAGSTSSRDPPVWLPFSAASQVPPVYKSAPSPGSRFPDIFQSLIPNHLEGVLPPRLRERSKGASLDPPKVCEFSTPLL